MKKLILLMLVFSTLLADSVRLDSLRTELYSKNEANTLRKIDLGLEFEGASLGTKKSQILDATNSVISAFFYEDIFTERGKIVFKDKLINYLAQKYGIHVRNIFILSVKGVEKFDLDELKSFLKDSEKGISSKNSSKSPKNKATEQNLSMQIPKIPALPDISTLLNDGTSTGAESDDFINIDVFLPNLNSLNIDPNALNIATQDLAVPTLDVPPKNQPIRLKDLNLKR